MKQKFFTLFATLLCCMSMYADGALSGKFTINDWGDQVAFSQGNLQYRQSDDTYRFAPTQYTIQGDQNQTALETIDAGNNTSTYIDLFGWGTGTAPYFHGTSNTSYPTFYEWGNEPITNGGNAASPWRTLTRSEWKYLFYVRNNAKERFAFGKVNGVNGLIILPDEWETPQGITFRLSTARGLEYTSGTYINTYENNYSHNTLNGTDWDNMEQAGAVFLPAAGSREGTKVSSAGQEGYYWSSEPDASETAYCTFFDKGNLNNVLKVNRSKGMAVRLVQEVPKLEVYTEFVEETGTLTYYYDMKRLERTGVTERYDPIGKPNAVRFTDYNKKVKKAAIDPSMKNAPLTSMRNMFYGSFNDKIKLSAMTTIEGLENLNTTNVTNMENLFYGCAALTSLDLSSFNTENVTDMGHMFDGCSALTSLDLSSFKTENVTNMAGMFSGCTALTSLNLSSFNTSSVKNMLRMFYYCMKLTSLDLSSFNTKNVMNMESMFCECHALQSLDLSSFNTFSVTDMSYMFNGCTALTSLNLSSFNTSSVTNMESLFYGCGKLTSLDLSLFNTSSVKNMGFMFCECQALQSLDLSSFNTSSVTDMSHMFNGCSGLTSLDLSSFNTSNVTDMSNMFNGCSGLTSLDLSSFNTSSVKKMLCMFCGCRKLTSLDLTSFNIENVTDMRFMFSYCSLLTTIYCNDDWSTSAALTDFNGMFTHCERLVGGKGTTYDESVIDKTYARPDGGTGKPGYFTKNQKEVYTVFAEATGTLTYYYDDKQATRSGKKEVYDPVNEPNVIRFTGYHDQVKKAVIDLSMKSAQLTSMRNMFYGGYMGKNYSLSAMTTIEGLENLNTAIVTNMSQMFAACSALTSLDLSLFDTQNVTDMNGMFDNCSSLQTLNVNSFDIGNVMNMAGMFNCCSELTTIYCSNNWSNGEAASSYMFNACNKLVGGEGTTWSEAVIDASYARPDGGPSAPGYFTIPATLKGDADNDGQVTAADIVAMTNYMMGNPPTGFNKANADVNLDGVINIADIVALANILLSGK